MAPAGLAAVATAKANGQWSKLDDVERLGGAPAPGAGAPAPSPARSSTTTKSFPAPCIFRNGTNMPGI